MQENEPSKYSEDGEGCLRRNSWLCVMKLKELVEEVLEECHHSKMTTHLGGDKMYQDRTRVFHWPRMRSDVERYVAKFLTCHRVKTEQKKPRGILRPLEAPQWKWENI